MFHYKPSIWGYPHLWKPPYRFIHICFYMHHQLVCRHPSQVPALDEMTIYTKLPNAEVEVKKCKTNMQTKVKTIVIGLFFLRENRQETPRFDGKNHRFLLDFPLKPIQWHRFPLVSYHFFPTISTGTKLPYSTTTAFSQPPTLEFQYLPSQRFGYQMFQGHSYFPRKHIFGYSDMCSI